MSKHIVKLSAATFALIAGLAGATQAQEAAPAAGNDLPEVLRALNLTDLEVKDGPRGGRKVEGDLPGGGEIEAFIDRDGNLALVEADDVAMPSSLIDTLLPQTVRDGEILSQFARIERIGGRDGRVMIRGEDSEGEDVRAGFDREGRLLGFGRGDDDDGKGRRGPKHGRGDHDHHKGKHWMHGDKDHARHGGKEKRGPRPMPQVDDAALNRTLDGAGYSDIGAARPAGPRLVLDAVNAAGEPVTLEIAPDGEVIRETARAAAAE
ncbi:hypothetical protein J7376_05620 [Paracoccus sp. R12_1]|uniref:hypothetical protein n=1 Tax=unclassified Paracoccus (in: a-proteobacteria) TaxID=2688777 RepID=UPI001ADA2F08|nr:MULTISPECIES: hypothetical protein [unclassified Paracoccus (in: a-proteobacteria)]MBO9455514.1 hypothetical protein [Paracoccus sp. R12_2]MBO9485993.1 hypothetical protein [Paracoccus sp. R12_1]